MSSLGKADIIRVFISIILITVMLPGIHLSTFVYSPLSVNVEGVQPPVIFRDPNEVGANVTLGPHNVSAKVDIKAVVSAQNLTANSGFDVGPDEWYFISGSYINQAYWLASYGGRGGIIELYGYSNSFTITTDSAYLVQNVTIPHASLNNLTLKIGYYILADVFSIGYIVVGLYNASSGTAVWSDSIIYSTGSWQDISFDIPISSVIPGETYLLYTGIYAYFIYDVSIYFDYIELEAGTANPSYTGLILDINSLEGVFYGSVRLDSFEYIGLVNVSLWLRNQSLVDSDRIIIINNAVKSNMTSNIMFNVTSTGYYSLSLRVDIGLERNSSCVLKLTFTYHTLDSSVFVNYTIILNISDPHDVRRVGSISVLRNVVLVKSMPKNIKIELPSIINVFNNFIF